jgi:two-component system, LytTR family, sensor histidine kinase AlgZ
MQGVFSTRRGAALYLLVWLMLGVVLAALVVSASGAAWINALLFALVPTLVYAFAAGFSAYYLCRAYPLADKGAVTVLVVLGAAAMVSGAMWCALCLAWNAMLQGSALAWAGIEVTRPLVSLLVSVGILLYGLSAVFHYLVIELERARLAERRTLEASLAAREAELRMLRTQIDPHFLFNSLNSISALTSRDAAGARAMTLQLADFFRRSLSLEMHKKVALGEEAALLAHFLAIEKIRFGARLGFAFDIGADASACLLPPMILQPLVENAVKHGIGNLTQGGTIRIAARRLGAVLRVSIENEVDADLPAPARFGIGLANVRQRLAAAYGLDAALGWTRGEQSFRVELSVPVQTMES